MYWSWAYDGVNASIPRNTGPECSEYISVQRKWIESIFVLAICISAFKWGTANAYPITTKYTSQHVTSAGRQILLVGMTFTLGLEMGFKLASRTVIYILNPCHITSIMQIYLLAAKPTKFTTALFRIHLNFLNGPLLAYVFPEIESRTMPLEAVTYYVQHALLFIIPIYLLRQGGAFNVEPLGDITWNTIGYSLLIMYHFSVLEVFAILCHVNLNHMLCPAILDPFEGQHYRLWACVHQAILSPILCKLFCAMFRPSTKLNLNVKIIGNIEQKQLENYLSSDNTGCDDNQSKTTQLIENIVNKVD